MSFPLLLPLPLPFALCILPLLPPLLTRIPLPTNQGPQALALAPLYLESFVRVSEAEAGSRFSLSTSLLLFCYLVGFIGFW